MSTKIIDTPEVDDVIEFLTQDALLKYVDYEVPSKPELREPPSIILDKGVRTFNDYNARNMNFKGMNLNHLSYIEDSNFSGADLSDVTTEFLNIRDSNFSKANMSGIHLKVSEVSDTDMSGVDLNEASIEYGKFKDVNMEKSNLLNASLHFSELDGVNFTGSDATGSKWRVPYPGMSDVNLTDVKLVAADLGDVKYIRDSTVKNVDFGNASITNIDFEGCEFENCKFGQWWRYDDVTRVKFKNCVYPNFVPDAPTVKRSVPHYDKDGFYKPYTEEVNIIRLDARESDFSGANLSNIEISMLSTEDSDFSGSNFENTTIRWGIIDNGDFGGSNFKNARLNELMVDDDKKVAMYSCNFEGAKFTACYLNNSEFYGSTFKNATIGGKYESMHRVEFRESDFSNAVFENTEFQYVDLSKAIFDYVVFKNCTFESVSFDEAKLSSAEFIKCTIKHPTTFHGINTSSIDGLDDAIKRGEEQDDE